MTDTQNLTPQDVADGLAKGRLTLVDIREQNEYLREHIKGALNIPLSALPERALDIDPSLPVVFHCKSGNRTEVNCDQLYAKTDGDVLLMRGGLNGWKASGLPTVEDRSRPIEINRQVQITAGLLTLSGVLLGHFLHSGFYLISAFIGAGLTFSGLTGSCAMASALMRMPWNR